MELYQLMKYILGNWKMNGSRAQAQALASAIAGFSWPATNTTVGLFPPFTSLDTVSNTIKNSMVALGAQDCSAEAEGAFTGEVSAAMLKESSCSYVIVGHSERRTLHGETDELVKRKAISALKAGLKPVICVGENLAERESGKYTEVITRQIENSLPSLAHSKDYIIAYEPVWAIGTGKVPTNAEIKEVHKMIASLLYRDTSGADHSTATAIVYGGSVKASNAHEIMAIDGVDGVLVGGASLKADEFGKIIEGAG